MPGCLTPVFVVQRCGPRSTDNCPRSRRTRPSLRPRRRLRKGFSTFSRVGVLKTLVGFVVGDVILLRVVLLVAGVNVLLLHPRGAVLEAIRVVAAALFMGVVPLALLALLQGLLHRLASAVDRLHRAHQTLVVLSVSRDNGAKELLHHLLLRPPPLLICTLRITASCAFSLLPCTRKYVRRRNALMMFRHVLHHPALGEGQPRHYLFLCLLQLRQAADGHHTLFRAGILQRGVIGSLQHKITEGGSGFAKPWCCVTSEEAATPSMTGLQVCSSKTVFLQPFAT
ncbi:hypothetical protein GWK47_003355 [Chionoecetes opilio]|uniref:Uncharacterized protein n=1 Tax=Chionoecetes opilio TaxID=41210 RepID=A0A8J4YYC3_CHIOP|nr:hypothetical protein GWK47_003355 [Chionoecetes opilio]